MPIVDESPGPDTPATCQAVLEALRDEVEHLRRLQFPAPPALTDAIGALEDGRVVTVPSHFVPDRAKGRQYQELTHQVSPSGRPYLQATDATVYPSGEVTFAPWSTRVFAQWHNL